MPRYKRYIKAIDHSIEQALNRKPQAYWYFALTLSLLAFGIGIIALFHTIVEGIGTWGTNRNVGWGISIVNFIWWIGIGHAGTFISAILLLFRKEWRNAISRIAETMTILAICCAGFFPLVHMGRVFYAFYTFPYPNTRNLWVNFNSPLLWDVFAITTYFIVSLIFWYVSMVPDLSYYAKRVRNRFKKKLFKRLSWFWNGSVSQRTWFNKTMFYMAGLSTALVISVHSIVSMDFATSIIPGWHTTIFPPYFVAGALLSGFAMVLCIVIVARKTMKLEKIITIEHIANMTNIVFYLGIFMGLVYMLELMSMWFSGNPYELALLKQRLTGESSVLFWLMVMFNVGIPVLFCLRAIRANLILTFTFSILINLGMWIERYNIVVTSLTKSYLSSTWTTYFPTLTEIGLFVGSVGFFFTGFLLLIRFLPAAAFSEIKKNYTTKDIKSNYDENVSFRIPERKP